MKRRHRRANPFLNGALSRASLLIAGQERKDIELASQHNPAADAEQNEQAAILRVIQVRADKAMFIDLDDPETQSGVMFMEQLGLLSTERAIEILTAPVQSAEEP